MSCHRVILAWLRVDGGAARQTVDTIVLSEARIRDKFILFCHVLPRARASLCQPVGELAAAATPPKGVSGPRSAGVVPLKQPPGAPFGEGGNLCKDSN